MTAHPLSFIHRFVPPAQPEAPVLLLLHGTGGDESDLLALGHSIAPNAALLAPRGQVLERGMPRFFRRLGEDVFDEADVRRRAADLTRFIEEARAAYAIGAPVAVGFSNGANIAAALLMLHPGVLAGAALLRPMMPLKEPPMAAIDRTPVLLLSGIVDPIAPLEEAAQLAAYLRRSGAVVEHEMLTAGHGLVNSDVEKTAAWLRHAPFSAASCGTRGMAAAQT